jgi:Group 4 capsule polysaccharide lipoprotein gfcB, YjbF
MSIFLVLRIFTKLAWLAAAVVSLVSCAGSPNVVGDVVRLAWQKSESSDPTLAQVLNPQYRYLRVTLGGRPFLLILGYVDQDAVSGEAVDVWYTGQGEVLKLKNGRLVGMTGTQSDWLAVRHTALPTWSVAAALHDSAAMSYVRTRDLKAAYQFGIQEQVTLKRIPAPQLPAIAGLPSNDLVWLEERYVSAADLPHNLPCDWALAAAASSTLGNVCQHKCALVFKSGRGKIMRPLN